MLFRALTVIFGATLALTACTTTVGEPTAVDTPAVIETTPLEVTVEETEPAGDAALDTALTMSVEEAGLLYLQAICPANEYIALVNEQMNNWVASTKTLTKKEKELVTAAALESRTAADTLDNPPAPWPANVQEGIDEVVVAVLQDFSAYQSAAKADTRTDAYVARNRYAPLNDSGQSQAQLVRLRLELPPAAVAKDGCGPFTKGIS